MKLPNLMKSGGPIDLPIIGTFPNYETMLFWD